MSQVRKAPRLPPAGLPIERLLREFGEPLIDALTGDNKEVVTRSAMVDASRDLKAAWEARRMSERFVGHAEALAHDAELEVEAQLRLLSERLQQDELRAKIFPNGLAASLLPRGHAQVAAAREIAGAMMNDPRENPAGVGDTAELLAATLTLVSRLGALEDEARRLEAALIHEHHAEYVFRQRIRGAQGALLRRGLVADVQLGGPSQRGERGALEPRALPPVPRSTVHLPPIANGGEGAE